MAIHADELAGKHSSGVDVRREWLETFVVAQNLGGTSSRHWGDEKRVARAELNNFLAQLCPVVSIGVGLLVPEIKLEFSLGKGRALEGLIWAFFAGNLHRGLHGCVVDRLEDQSVYVCGLVILKSDLHLLVSVSEPLNTNADRAMAHVGVLGFLDWVVVPVNYPVQIPGDSLCDLVEELVVEFPSLLIGELGQ
jgi:hypothetical protein